MDHWAQYNAFADEAVVLVLCCVLSSFYSSVPRGEALPGAVFLRQLLKTGSPFRIKHFLRMKASSFARKGY